MDTHAFDPALLSLESLFTAMPLPVTLRDRQGRHVALNQAMAELNGMSMAELLGLRVADHATDEGARFIEEDFHAFDLGLEVPDREMVIQGRPFLIKVKALRAPDGFTVALLVAMTDISLHKETERQLAEANQALEGYALQDYLTGVWNRRYFEASLAREVSRALREKSPLSLILFDVDNFKLYNDDYGHTAGDDCLRSVAAAAQRGLRRPTDELCRYGGEEFVVLLPSTEAAGAMAVAEAVRLSVADMNLRHEKNPFGLVTISLGVSCLALETRSAALAASALVEAADLALYAAKAAGRNNSQPSGPQAGIGRRGTPGACPAAE